MIWLLSRGRSIDVMDRLVLEVWRIVRRRVLLTWAWHFHPKRRSEKLIGSETKQFLRRKMVEAIIIEIFHAESHCREGKRSREFNYSFICTFIYHTRWKIAQNLEKGNLHLYISHLPKNLPLQDKLTYHLPLRVMTAQVFPSLSVSFSTLVENEIALIIPSPNFSFNTALYAYP